MRVFHIAFQVNTVRGSAWGDVDYYTDKGMSLENLAEAKKLIAKDCEGIIGTPVILYWQEYEQD